LGLIYDLTPAEFVTALITEVGIIPPSSVPVIIRETKDRQESNAVAAKATTTNTVDHNTIDKAARDGTLTTPI